MLGVNTDGKLIELTTEILEVGAVYYFFHTGRGKVLGRLLEESDKAFVVQLLEKTHSLARCHYPGEQLLLRKCFIYCILPNCPL